MNDQLPTRADYPVTDRIAVVRGSWTMLAEVAQNTGSGRGRMMYKEVCT